MSDTNYIQHVYKSMEFQHIRPKIHPHIYSDNSTISHTSYNMETILSSDSDSRESVLSQSHEDRNVHSGFAITPKDTEILQKYLEEFQEADSSLRTKIIQKAMAELYLLRPENTPFDKKEASKVCRIYVYLC